MKGTITAFDPKTFRGTINAHDGQQYEFAAQDWREAQKAKARTKVDFRVDGSQAHEIYLDDRVAAIAAKFPGPVIFRPSLVQRTEWFVTAVVVGLIALVCMSSALTNKSGTLVTVLEAGGTFLFGALAIAGVAAVFVPNEAMFRLDEDGYAENLMFARLQVKWDASLLPNSASGKKVGFRRVGGSFFRVGKLRQNDFDRLMRRWCERALRERG